MRDSALHRLLGGIRDLNRKPKFAVMGLKDFKSLCSETSVRDAQGNPRLFGIKIIYVVGVRRMVVG